MTSRKRALLELCVLLATIGVVTGIFKFGLDPKIAGVLAGLVFLLIGIGIIWIEKRYGRGQGSLAWWSMIFFLGLFAIPLLLLRLVFWEASMDQVGFWSITGTQIHHFSRYFYVLVVITVIIEGLRKDHTY